MPLLESAEASGPTVAGHGQRRRGPARIAEVLALGLFLGLFLFSVRVVLHPMIVYAVLLLFLVPHTDRPIYRRTLVAVTGLLLAWLASVAGAVLSPFVLAMIFAYLLDPLVDLLERRHLPRSAAVLALVLPVLAALAGVVLLISPPLAREVGEFLRRLPPLLSALQTWLVWAWAEVLGREGWVAPGDILSLVGAQAGVWVQRLLEGLAGLGRGVGWALGILSYLLLTPVLTVYLLRDIDRLRAWGERALPEGQRAGVRAFLGEFDLLLGRYLRGQLLVSLAVGILTGTLLALLGVEMPLLLGFLAGALNMVPYIGLWMSFLAALLVALMAPDPLGAALRVVGVFAGVQALEATVLSPRIIGPRVGLHPVAILLALALGSFLAGFTGLLLAIPGAIGVKLLLRRAGERWGWGTAAADA